MMYLGVDCGTQSTKVVVFDTQKAAVIAQGESPHELIGGGNGRQEQHPKWWIQAFREAFQNALSGGAFQAMDIDAVGVSGQQHGLVVLDDAGDVIRPAKLWCDTETAEQNAEIVAALGGTKGCIDTLGLAVATGYTASKLLWLKQNEPDNFAQVAHILLPHDYLNYWLTGEYVMEYGDASGTGLLDIRQRCWSDAALATIDDPDRLRVMLPTLIEAQQAVGTVRSEVSLELGLRDDVLVSSGGGDNMMGAIGTGNIEQGVVTASLGTSGTLYAYSDQAPDIKHPLIAPFCSSSNGWLLLICTMNLTGAVNHYRDLFGWDLTQMQQAVERSPIGAQGLTLLPFLNGERVPALPNSSASLLGMNAENLTPDNIMRSALEGVTFGLRLGMDLLRGSGIDSQQLRLIGGGANSPLWRQMMADVMNCPVVCPTSTESAALGAAIQAHWCHLNQQGQFTSLKALCERFSTLNTDQAVSPNPDNVARYEQAYQRYRQQLLALYPESI